MKNKINNLLENKKAFILRDFVIAGVLFSGVVAIAVLMIFGMSQEYPQSDLSNANFDSQYNKLTVQTESIELIRNTTLSNEGLTFQGAFNVAFGSTFTAIRVIFGSLELFGTMTSSFAEDMTGLNLDKGIITILMTMFISIVCVVLLFVWLSSVSRGRL
jgi:hypothetical protein